MMHSNPANTSSSPVVLDLFCGAGGMSLGFALAGYHIGLGIEKWEPAARTHAANFGGACHVADITTITDPGALLDVCGLDRVDVIIGGPPCQGFSRVGRGKLRSVHNDPTFLHDPRNQYYREFIRFIEVLQPYYFVMENVPEIETYHDGEDMLLDKAARLLAAAGYDQRDRLLLHAHHYGVPQTRKRLFFIGNRVGLPVRWPDRFHLDSPLTVWDAISDLPIVAHNHRHDEIPYVARQPLNHYQNLMRETAGDVLFNHQTRWHNPSDLEAFALMPLGGKYVNLPADYKRYRDDIFKDKYRKLYRDQPSWTIEAHIGRDTYRHIYPSISGEPEPPRTISVREAARLQSFPDRFRFEGAFTLQFSQVGNAVPPLLARAIAEALLPDVQRAMTGLASCTREEVVASRSPGTEAGSQLELLPRHD